METNSGKPRFIILDVETTGLSPHHDQLHGLGICWEEDESAYFPVNHLSLETDLLEWLADPDIAKVGHNLRFDLKFLAKAGVEVRGKLHDTKLLAQLVNENRPLGLKDLAAELLGVDSLEEKREIDRLCQAVRAKHVGDLCRLDLLDENKPYYDVIAKYCKEDCNNTYKLFLLLGQQLKAIDLKWKAAFKGITCTPLDYYKDEAQPVEEVLLKLEQAGICLDSARVEEARAKLQEEGLNLLSHLEEACHEEIEVIQETLYNESRAKRLSEKGKAKVERTSEKYGTCFNWGSGDHLARLFYDRLQCPAGLVNKTKSGKRSTAEADLFRIQGLLSDEHRLKVVLDLYAKWKKLQKFLNTYIGSKEVGLLSHVVDGRIYADYLQVGRGKDAGAGGTLTGRLSSQNPNMQNLPRSGPVKRFFIPPPASVFAYFDYSQVELRIAAHLSQDQEFLNAYKKGLDLHAITASAIFHKDVANVTKDERQIGKTFNFALIYDAAAYRLWEELSACGASYSIEDCERMRKAFFQRYNGYKAFLGRIKSFVQEHYCVISPLGRVRRLPEIEYFDGLNWQTKTWQGSPELRKGLLLNPAERISEEERFQRAKKKAKHALKQAYNFPIQSFGASITKRALIQLHESGFKVVSTVHDSIIIELPKAKVDSWRFAQRILQNAMSLSVPLVCEGKLLHSLDEADIVVDKLETAIETEGVLNENYKVKRN